ncbi:AraC family transcriptional regulator [Neptunicella sp.]|uniref:AraC family transcriptional regulator n=1 Tax=Neptunicella sp. TaxID=2125986 RepID=UPI003F693CE7
MTTSIFTQSGQIRPVSFSRNKYATELLIDVAWIGDMPSFARTIEPYVLDFYDITLITQGQGTFWLDDKEYTVSAGQVFFTTPGQVRRWYVKDLQGICLFFPAEFLLKHFSDPLFLHRLHYFHTHTGPFSLRLEHDQQQCLLDRLEAMHQEVNQLQPDSPNLLRAIAYEVLVYLNRWYTGCYGQVMEIAVNHTVSRFRQSLETHYHRYHKVSEYAALLAVTPGHLNVLCKQHLGRAASRIIMDRLITEACRLLTHSKTDIATLAEVLGFTNATYFSRVFKRELGQSPLHYRQCK